MYAADLYKGSQLSLPPDDNQWYKESGGNGREGIDGGDGTDGGVSTDDDQLLKTPPPLPQAYPNWYMSGDESKGSAAMDICSVKANVGDPLLLSLH